MASLRPARRVGASRQAFLIGPYAIKMPSTRAWTNFLWGLIANLNERRRARLNTPTACPVLLADPIGLIVVMPRCEPLGRDVTDAEYDAITQGDDWLLPVERKPDSFGWLGERLVAVDYG